MCIDPITVPVSFGQNRAAAYDDRPSTLLSCSSGRSANRGTNLKEGAHLGECRSNVLLAPFADIKTQQASRLGDERDDRRKDQDRNEDRRDGVEASPAIAIDEERGDDDSHGAKRVCHDVLRPITLQPQQNTQRTRLTRKTPCMLCE